MDWVLVEIKPDEVARLFQPGEVELKTRTYSDCVGLTFSIIHKASGQSRRSRDLEQHQRQHVSMDPVLIICPEDRTHTDPSHMASGVLQHQFNLLLGSENGQQERNSQLMIIGS